MNSGNGVWETWTSAGGINCMGWGTRRRILAHAILNAGRRHFVLFDLQYYLFHLEYNYRLNMRWELHVRRDGDRRQG